MLAQRQALPTPRGSGKATRMVEKHYAHLSPSYIADTIRENFPAFGIVQDSNVVPLEQKR